MVTDGVVANTSPSSSIDFRIGDNLVAYIGRNDIGKTIATLVCLQWGDTGAVHTVDYLGWDDPTPEPVTIVTSPALPISVAMGPGSTVNVSKSDGSAFTEQEITGLRVTANGTLCEISWRDQAQQWAVVMGSTTISYIRASVIGQTAFDMTLAGSAAYTVETIELS